ncbi:Fumarate hydratase class I, aerobic [bioreactor metagenome]|uniref:Fumarate hydratase class I, aerobic n=1 Tax=bioreactor metagenome TaxID=1076179 RepID=A0A645B1I2_9ZZZZ|nr:FumA C-terminus/TtdB family hydratase beta subunit [Christensenella sp.]
MDYRLCVPVPQSDLAMLRAGDVVRLSGTIYTARDAAHARFAALLQNGEPLPVPKGACIYYAGPCPAAPGEVIGPCGPTTSKRMDAYTPALIDYGIRQLIGKGARAAAVNEAMRGRAVHFSATGGAGMLYASRITQCELVAFEDLGAEAVYRLTVEEFPVVVSFDLAGRDIYQRG